MIITIGSLKGGVGKSTIAVNAAVELTRLGLTVNVVDADPIATTANWLGDRSKRSPDRATVKGMQARGSLRDALIDMDKLYDVVLVDVGGYDSQEFRTAAINSDMLIVPMKVSAVDTDTMAPFVKLLKQILDFNPELTVRGLFTQAPTNARQAQRLDDAKGWLADYPEIPLFQTTLYQRSAYMDVMPLGRGVIEWSDSKAKAEVQVLVQEMRELS
jgi:chromosome partitioning protein